MAAPLPSLLADGQLANAEGDLYAATGSVFVRCILLFNNDTADQTVHLFLHRSGGTSREVFQQTLGTKSSVAWPPAGTNIPLANGDKIRGYAGTASKVNYVIGGGT